MKNRNPASQTKLAYIATRVLDTPFWALYNMIPVILYKDLQAAPWQLALVIALKPLVSFLSIYWSSAVNNRRDRLISNILWARLIGYLPFFFLPWIENANYLIFAFGLYMMLTVGVVPAWMEVLKLNIPSKSREKVFSYTQAFGYLGGGLLPFLLGWVLDSYFEAWRWLLPIAAGTALLSYFFQRKITLEKSSEEVQVHHSPLTRPWRSAIELLRKRKDFLSFQIGFMVVGSGLMIIQPVLPIFFVDQLKLSYMEISVALTFCKGIGFAGASPLWARWMHQTDIFRLSSWISGCSCLFPLLLLLAPFQIAFLYASYILYGVAQSGNELIWNLSGPYFAKNEDSSVYTSVNVMGVGLRGAVIPALGSTIAASMGAPLLMGISSLLALTAMASMRFFREQVELSGKPLSASQNS